jgi:hypothetical protein
MPARWKLFRIVCILQMLAASVFAIMALIRFFEAGSFSTFIRILLYLLIFLQTILAVNIINNNYPDTPVTGKQKSNFNRLFLLNFLFLVVLFGIVFAEYRQLNALAQLTGKSIFELPFEWLIYLVVHLIILVFQFIILYGLYQLRRELYFNFMKKEFDFEKNQSLR